jgi:hypothetical protein
MNNEKQVILLKTEYDAMEKELTELRAVVDSRIMAKILVPHTEYYRKRIYGKNNWGVDTDIPYHVIGTKVHYVSGIDNEKVVVELAKIVEGFDECKKLLTEKTDELIYVEQKLSGAQDEIKRLSGKWYNRFFKK